jgi:CRISPR-associated protein Cas5t
MLRLRIRAPYAAFRPFTAGWYRPTASFATPSALYGLLLNVAAIESRREDGALPMTLTADDVPRLELAIGIVTTPSVQRLYQQLHNYPVGESGKERSDEAKGNKYNIQPVRREILSGLDACVAVRGNDGLETRIRDGLQLGSEYAPEGKARYGLPFLGDNNFTVSILREESVPARWLVRVDPERTDPPESGIARLTVWIDRQDMSRTASELYHPTGEETIDIPAGAWTLVPPEPMR